MLKFLKKYFGSTEYFPAISSGERIKRVFETHIAPELEKHGYQFDNKKVKFWKEQKGFTIEIELLKNKYNSKTWCVGFMPVFYIYSKKYNKWLKDTFNQDKENYAIYCTQLNHINGWTKESSDGGWYDLAQNDNKYLVEDLLKNIITIAIPHIDQLTDFNTAVDYIKTMERYYMAPMLFDFCVLEGNKNKAEEVLLWFNNFKNESGKKFLDETLTDIKIREKYLKNWV